MNTFNGQLLELVEHLDALGPEPSLIGLAHAMESVHLTLADIAPFVQTNPKCYNRAHVIMRDHYELLVMTWLPGQASVPHDHNGCICIMRVVQGEEAAEAHYRLGPDGFVDLEYEQIVGNGQVSAGQDAGIHSVRNASVTGEILVTLHAYAPPLQDFRRFILRPEPLAEKQRTISKNPEPRVVIVGGGFSGSMTAAQILRRAGQPGADTPLQVVLVERRGAVGEGLAYATREPAHLLNVPAGRMSGWPDRPDDFVQWAGQRYGNVAPADFLPRQWYGEYVRDSLLASADDAAETAKLSVVFDEVRRVARHPKGGWLVHLERGASLHADAVVLAIGHRPPSDPIGSKWLGPRTRFISDPWRPFAMNQIEPDEAVVVLGSGLTAVDAVLSIAARGRCGQITLVSRNGLLPQAHAATPVTPVDLRGLADGLIAAPGGVRARTLLWEVRRTVRALGAQGVDWRAVVDGLRPHIARLWQAMPTAERRRFISRVRPFWEIHRHRMALPVAERFAAMLDRGEVRICAGRVISVEANEKDVHVIFRPRGTDRRKELQASWVINCTGPMPSNRPESNPVIGSLLVQGQLSTDELALGLKTSPAGNAIAADGREVPGIFIVGTLRKPDLWESTAVPELRGQAETAAERILDLLTVLRQAKPLCQEKPASLHLTATPAKMPFYSSGC